MSLAEIGFAVACGERAHGRKGVGRRPVGEAVVKRGQQLMDERIAEYAAMDAATVKA